MLMEAKMLNNNSINKKTINMYIFIIFIIIIFIVVGILMLKYHVEGEKNLPFNLTKIGIISTGDTVVTNDTEGNLKAELIAKNNIYFYIDKNPKYNKEEIITKILFDNFVITKTNEKGEVKIYKPSKNDNIYEYSEQYEIKDSLEYNGADVTNTETIEIGNQGGLIGLSIAIRNLGEYTPTKNEKLISDGTLLNKGNVTLEDTQIKASFDITIQTESGNKFKSNIILDLPTGNILQDGVNAIEKTDATQFIFKRI